MFEVLVNRLGGLSLPRKSVVRLTDRPDMTLAVYHGRKTTTQQQQLIAIGLKDLIRIASVRTYSWKIGCPPVWRDNPQVFLSGLSTIQADKPCSILLVA